MNLIKLLTDNMRTAKQPVRIVRNGAAATLYIYDVIGKGVGISAVDVMAAIAAAGDAKVLNVHINSPGGDVFESRAIMSELRRFKGKTVAHIDSLCASAATSIAIACQEIEMAEGAFFMIHNASGLMWGNKNDMREMANLLEKIEGSIVADYTGKTSKSESQIRAWMDDETWFTATEARQHGFVDRVLKVPAAENQWNLSSFDKAPAKCGSGRAKTHSETAANRLRRRDGARGCIWQRSIREHDSVDGRDSRLREHSPRHQSRTHVQPASVCGERASREDLH